MLIVCAQIVNLETNAVERILGKVEMNDRFLKIALYQGYTSTKVRKNSAAAANVDESKDPSTDPTLLCCAFKKHRIYLFSRREPNNGRDENLPAEELVAASSVITSFVDHVILHTKLGYIYIKLYREECPKTVDNFTTLCHNGYYNNVIFHEVVRGVVIKTGSPRGPLTNGVSIWGGNFEDKFHESLRHDLPFTVSMDNEGEPNTNGSLMRGSRTLMALGSL
ncbi:hypothetical protein C5167_006999 [Papaver somniferum]|uniref:Peptidyl-prolyl cis-trans isomerase n=1 Tax=Papaver somniferum TaxID=3469 RepID=A0A4Y7JI07_PAPSO|nr:hypothetical protein C5167_006999 [Papaver somniferum]